MSIQNFETLSSNQVPLGLPLGQIIKWPGGYAMTLGYSHSRGNVVRCCEGHETPEAAKQHGIVMGLEIMQTNANHFIEQWAAINPGT